METPDRGAGQFLAEAVAALRAGDWSRARDLFAEVLCRRLAQGARLEPEDWAVIEQLANLAGLLGETAAAAHLLTAQAAAYAEQGLDFAVDYLTLKLAQLALEEAGPHRALDVLARTDSAGRPCLLGGQQPRLGPVEEVPWQAPDLPAWEAQARWRPSPRVVLDRPFFFSRLYLLLGRLLAREGSYGHAAVLLGRGRELAGPGSSLLSRWAERTLTLTLAGVRLEQGLLDEAALLLEAAAPAADGTADERVGWLEGAGQLHWLRGAYGPALDCFREVADLCRRGGAARAVLGALLNLADLLLVLNQVRAAEQALDEAGALAEALGDRASLLRVGWRFHLGRARVRWAEEREGLPAAVEMQKAGPARQVELGEPDLPSAQDADAPENFLAFFDQRAQAVQWALAQGEVSRADDLLADMRVVFAKCESPLIRLRLHALAGMVCYDAGEWGEAERILAEACPQLERLGLRPDLWQTLRCRTWCGTRLGAPAQEQDQRVRRVQQLLDEMADSLPPDDRAVFLLNKWTIEEHALLARVGELDRERQEVEAAPWYRRPWRRWRLWRKLHDFLTQLDENRRGLAGQGGGEPSPPVSLWSRLWRHPWRSATLSFLVLPDRVFVARAGWLSLDFAVRLLPRLQLRQQVAAWHQGMMAWRATEGQGRDIHCKGPREADPVTASGAAAQPGTSTGNLRPEATRLRLLAVAQEEQAAGLVRDLDLAELLGPLPRWVRRLTVVPDDALHGLPFALLPLEDGKQLVDRFALTLGYDRTAAPGRPAPCGGTALAVAVAVEVQGEVEGEVFMGDPLPQVLAEVEAVRRWLSARGFAVNTLVDGAAGRAAVLGCWRQASFVHLACHGIFRPDRPDGTGLVLVPGPGQVEVLSLRQLGQEDLRHVRHVTLSCCWGADNFVLPGRWIVSLPETLCRRGAESVLACLWEVDDEVGQAFSAHFYALLEHWPRAQALAETQRACRDNKLLPAGNGRRTEHPYYWAGYRLHGNGGPLHLPRG